MLNSTDKYKSNTLIDKFTLPVPSQIFVFFLQGVYPSSSKQLDRKMKVGTGEMQLPWLTSPQQYRCLYKSALYNCLLYIKLTFHYSGNTKCWQRRGLFDSIIHWWNKHNLFRSQCLSTALKKQCMTKTTTIL